MADSDTPEFSDNNTDADADESPQSQPTRSRATFAIMLSLAFLIPAFLLLRSAAIPIARASYAAQHGFIQLDNEEGALLYQARQIQTGGMSAVYRPLDNPPYVAGTYTPLYMTIVAAMDDFTAPNFSLGRTIVWISALGIAICLMLLVSTITRIVPLGVLTGFLFLATWEVYQWIGYFRVDFPAIFLSLTGLTVLSLSRAHRTGLVISAILMTAALYTKQTTIAAPAACFLGLLLTKKRKAVELVFWMLVFGIPPLVALELTTHGQFLKHTILYNMNVWHLFNLKVWSRHVWGMHSWLLLCWLLAIPYMTGHMIKHIRQSQYLKQCPLSSARLYQFWIPPVLYGILAQWNFLAIAKAGSAENYLLEPLAGLAILVCIAAGCGIRKLMQHPLRQKQVIIHASIPILILLCITAQAWKITRPHSQMIRFSPMSNPSRADFDAARTIRELMRDAEHPYCELAAYHMQSKKPVVIQPFIMSELARQNRWDQQPFIQSIEAQKFDVVIALSDLAGNPATDVYTPQMLRAFQLYYKVERVLKTPLWTYYILVPSQSPNGAALNQIASL